MALIYIVEDDESIREIETIALKNSGHMVGAFGSSKEFFKKLDEILPDLVLLDVMLPDESGYDIIKKLRLNSATKRLPVIMVTAKSTELDMIKGLEDGADDYIKKPFSVMELITRVKALLRRTGSSDEEKLIGIGSLFIDDEKRVAYVDDKPVELTYKEYELLKYLALNRGIVLTRDNIMDRIWSTDYEGESRTLDVHIKTLRHKLGTAGNYIKTVRNVGYFMDDEAK
mgnify:FL=1